jgi:hypothetical protein
MSKNQFNFTPNPDCENCGGDGIFAEAGYVPGADAEPCAFCLEDAIKRGELDGEVDGIKYRGGKSVA